MGKKLSQVREDSLWHGLFQPFSTSGKTGGVFMIGLTSLWNRLRTRPKSRRKVRHAGRKHDRFGIDLLEKRQMLAVTPASDFTYTTANGQVAITGYTGSAVSVEIPATINGMPVTAIGANAFQNRTSLGSVTIPSGITTIGDTAFEGCTGITSLSLPSSVASLGFASFRRCTGMTSLSIEPGVKVLSNSVFAGCNGLKVVNLPESITTLGDFAFADSVGLASITIPDSVTYIGNAAFRGCLGLSSVVIPDSVSATGTSVFQYCVSLRSVSLSRSDSQIAAGNFAFCTALTEITIPAGVTGMGDEVFKGCTSLTVVTMQGSPPTIGTAVFEDVNPSQAVVYYPAGTNGWTDTFGGLPARPYELPEVPTSVVGVRGNGQVQLSWAAPTSNGGLPVKDYSIQYSSNSGASWQTFSHTPSTATSATVAGLTNGTNYLFRVASVTDGGSSAYSAPSAVVTPQSDFQYTTAHGQVAITGYTGSAPTVEIPATIDGLPVTSIADNAFFNMPRITSILVPFGVQSIGFGSFAGTSITTLHLPASVTSFSNSTYACHDLAMITVDPASDAFVSIDGILYDKTLQVLIRCPSAREQAVTIPDTVTAIGYAAFIHCSKLTTIIGLQPTANIGWDAFSYCNNLRYMLQPSASTAPGDYLTYTIQSNYVNGIIITGHSGTGTGVAIPDTIFGRPVVGIGSDAFNTHTRLESISIPDSVTGIGNAAFANCTNLKSIALPAGVTYIGFDAFHFCLSLTSITLPASLQVLVGNGHCFYGSSNLVSINVDQANEYFTSVDGLLYDKALRSLLECPKSKQGVVVLPSSVTSIGTAFAHCTRLSRIVIPDGVTSLVVGAFENCPAVLESAAASPLAPGKPAGVRGNGQVQLSWTAPVSDGGRPVKDYAIQYSTDGSSWKTFTHAASSATSVTVTGLTNGTAYLFRVASVNDAGTGLYSVHSSAVTPATTPGTATSVVGLRGNGQVQLSWAAPTSNGGLPVKDYSIQYSSNSGSSWQTFSHAASTALSATVTGLTNGTNYLFRVASVNDAGTGSYSATSAAVTPATVPTAPSAVLGGRGNGQVQLSWAAPASNGGLPVKDYTIQYSTNGASWQTFSHTPSTATSATVTGLTNRTGYLFRVAGVNDLGAGSYASLTSKIVPSPVPVPLPPSNVVATRGNGVVRLAWNPPGATAGLPMVDYMVQYSTNGGLTWAAARDGLSTKPSAVISGLVIGRDYIFRVAAVGRYGAGDFSLPSGAVRVATVPNAPLRLVALAGLGQVNVSWKSPASEGGTPVSQYIVQYAPWGGRWVTAATVGANTTAATVGGLLSNRLYSLRVFAVNEMGMGASSVLVNARTLRTPAAVARA